MFPERLTQGYRAFLDGRFADERSRYEMLAEKGQRPEIMVVGCVDSRVSPEVIFDAAPGELLVVRNVANIVPRYEPDRDSQHGTSAALEFGVRVLAVQHVVVMGHGLCGGARALLEGAPAEAGDFVRPWMQIAAPLPERVLQLPPEARQEACEQEIVRLSLANLQTFPWIREAVETGRLALHGCHFDVRTGKLARLEADGVFRPVRPIP